MNRSLSLVLAVAFPVLACVPRANVPAGSVAAGTRMSVVLDRNIPAQLPEDKKRAQAQIGDWMEGDLVNVLRDAGYQSGAVRDPRAAPAGARSYVLAVRLIRYNPGSTAARMFVGFGAGAASLDVHYELRTRDGRVLLSHDDGVGSGADWRKVARVLNVRMTEAVAATLSR
jgi:hypothetical protein